MIETLKTEFDNLNISRNKHGGGKNTNINGLQFEKQLVFKYNILKKENTNNYKINIIEFEKLKDRKFIYTQTKKVFIRI